MYLRYQTFARLFKILLWLGGIFLVFKGCQSCINCLGETSTETPSGSSFQSQDAPQTQTQTQGSYALVQFLANRQASSPKVKDATHGQGWKINLYDDNSDGRYDRIKIDQNRDEIWDEDWTQKNGLWTRNSDGATFQSLSAAPAPAPAPATQNASVDYSYIETLANAQATSEKVKDATKGKPWKVNLYDDNKDGRFDRFKIDRNRDNVWDEAWTRKADGHWERDGDGAHIESLTGQRAPAAQNASVDYSYIERLANAQATSDKVKDATKGKPWKVNLYDDNKDGRFDRFKIDRNRDNVWDEAWTRKADGHWERDGDGAHIDQAR